MVRRAALAVVVAVLALAGCGSQAQPAATVQPVTAPAATAAAEPVSITIPDLDVVDEVVPVGLAPDGSMEVPDVDVSGWYDLGPRPGDIGRATVVGHVNYGGKPGALGRIGELDTGDTVTVKDASGIEHTFVVYLVRQIAKADYTHDTAPLVFGPSTGQELALVTCSGRLIGHEYDSNTVVLARAL